MKDTLNLGKINPNEQRNKVPKHIPSKVHPDTLFTFMTDFGFLLGCLEHKMLSPRYCEEDVRYLNLRRVKSLAYPMKCFCDISLKKLKVHMDWYGDYGIAFKKEWGMRHNIQPVHYLNEESDLRKDITEVLKAALNEEKAGSKTHEMLKNYLLHELMYYKPYQTSVYKGYKQDKIEMRGDRAEMSDFPLYLNTVAGGLDRRDQTIGGFSFVVKIYAVPVVEIIG